MQLSKRKKIKYIFIVVVLIIAAFALMDATGVFNPRAYRTVTIGSKTHYVPNDRDPDVSISKFPTVKPLPFEVITPTGQIVPKDSLKNSNE